MANRREQGNHWEDAAESFLHQRGLTTVRRNYHGRIGEIDLIMLDGPVLVFTEVRYRGSNSHGGGAASVTAAKQRKIIQAARRFLACEKRHAHRRCRFDVVSIGSERGRTVMNWIRSAFSVA
jgi:putative endonuclease